MHRTSRPSAAQSGFSGFWHSVWSRRADELTDAGEAGELLVARARFAIAALIMAVPVVSVVREPANTENWVGLSVSAVSTAVALAVFLAVRSGWRPRWIGLATSLYDVTSITLVLASFFLIRSPHMAINSRVTFQVYFLAIAASSLRYDRRVCMTAGLVAAAQYSLLVWIGAHFWDLNSPAFAPYTYGMYSAADQIGRVILLVLATLLSATLVDRTERLRVLSTHDALTELYNRAYFDERLVEELLRARRYARPLTLVIIDLDLFKQVNDQHGHVTGDVVLQRFADILRESVRRTDIVARFGGEEFALILPETTALDGQAKLERIREQVASTEIEVPGRGRTLRLTFSAGVAGTPLDGQQSDDLVASADARLFEAKANGRNRIVGPVPEPVG